MKQKVKERLDQLNHVYDNNKRKSSSEPIMLFIAEMVAETNGSIKWLIWLVGLGFAAGLGVLITLACRGIS